MKNKLFQRFIISCVIFIVLTFLLVSVVNVKIDAAGRINPRYSDMAKMALDGNVVATPENYNEREYQVCVVNQMETIPETVVIGSSRGMFLGEDITGYKNLYNNCVSGACLEDDYALLGLYYEKFGKIPKRVIIETSPWVLFENNPESRWKEIGEYNNSALKFYEKVNHEEMNSETNGSENPYVSVAYFQYNMEQLLKQGPKAIFEKEQPKISTNDNEAAEYPDGTIRYEVSVENESEKRLAEVKKTSAALTYQNANLMEDVSSNKSKRLEIFVDYLLDKGCEVIFFLQPFSVTQCIYSIDQNMNPGFILAEEYLIQMSAERNIEVIGSYDSRNFGLTDERFIDAMHLDKKGTEVVWKQSKKNTGY